MLANFGKYAISDCPFILVVDILPGKRRLYLSSISLNKPMLVFPDYEQDISFTEQ